LFHNSNISGSRIIHILYTGCAKIKKNSCVERLSIYIYIFGFNWNLRCVGDRDVVTQYTGMLECKLCFIIIDFLCKDKINIIMELSEMLWYETIIV